MAMSIFKYELPVAESFMLPGHHDELLITEVELPLSSSVLKIAEQHGKPVVWMQVVGSMVESRKFVLLATGVTLSDRAAAELDRDYQFVDTIQLNGGHFVLHVFMEQ